MISTKSSVRVFASVLVAALGLFGAACSDADDGGGGAAGTYTHAEEGTIILEDGGAGTWEQEGNDEPFEFEWREDGDVIVFSSDGEDAGEVTIEDGNLVLPPDLISGDDPVTFERQ